MSRYGDTWNLIRREIENWFRSNVADPRIAIVQQVDTGAITGLFCARVSLLPEGTLTGWLPIQVNWMGNGWGMLGVPLVGSQVYVSFQEFNRASGTITGFHYDNSHIAPKNADGTFAQQGEMWLVHQSGSSIKLTNDGAIRTQANTFYHVGQLHVSGSIAADDNVSAGTGATGSFTSDGVVVVVQNGIVLSID